MGNNNQLSVLVSCVYVILLWPHVKSVSIFSEESTGDVTSADQGEQRPHVGKRSAPSCDTSFDTFCLNNGQCVFLEDLKQNTCKCELGFRGSRCEQPQLVWKPGAEDQVALIIVCVILLIIGLAGALYFFCKWYRRNRIPQQK